MNRIIALLIAGVLSLNAMAQQQLTRDQILAMSMDELSELSLEELMQAVETLGVSSVDELFALILNKNVSSASKEEESSFTSPLSTTVITHDELRTYGISTIEEAFRLIPGMIVSEKTNGIYDVQMRGLNNIPDNNYLLYTENCNILVMVDGRIDYNYATGGVRFEQLPISIEDVDRIEVVRGASSALYGPNAINGFVNIITIKPDQSSTVASGSAQFGNDIMTGEISLRKPINSSIAIGLSANMQLRYRPTSKMYLIPDGNDIIYAPSGLSVDERSYLSDEQLQQYYDDGTIVNVSDGGYFSVDQIQYVYEQRANIDGSHTFHAPSTAEYDIYDIWANPDISRKTYGVNGYVAITPSPDVRIDVTGGYDYSFVYTTPLRNSNFSLRPRESKVGYVNVNASVYGLHLVANYSDGSQDFDYHAYPFQYDHTPIFSAQAEYKFKLGPVSLVPGFGFQFVKYMTDDPVKYDYGNGEEEISTYFGYYSNGDYTAHLRDYAPSLRVDWRIGDIRFIAAGRMDKTNLPDKWNPSWQFVASYSFNDNNFIRFNYGRAFSAQSLMNASANYLWRSVDKVIPTSIKYLSNEDASLVHIDNFELGYRWRPASNLIIDAEAFYSISEDYGALKCYQSMLTMTSSDLLTLMPSYMTGQIDLSSMESIYNILNNYFSTRVDIQYDDMPFKVHQMGIGLNVDWVISPSLMAKLNANIQRTTIDNYYQYSQSDMISKQITTSVASTLTSLGSLAPDLIAGVSTYGTQYLTDAMNYTEVAENLAKYNQMTSTEQEAYLQSLLDAYASGNNNNVEGTSNALSLYYALKYNVNYDKDTDEYYFGTSVVEDYEKEDGHHHKATPSFYGSLGLIYKPIDKLSCAAFANFMSKREYTTYYGTQELDAQCTVNLKVGYSPISNCEIFVNAHNLFNRDKREFVYTDKIGGIYSVGVNFGF